MKAVTFEELILDQVFKMSPMNVQFKEYLDDCFGKIEEE